MNFESYSKQVNENDRVRFRCMRCAKCCRNVFGAVIVDSLDIFRLTRYLKLDAENFILKYTDQFVLDEKTVYSIFSLKTVGENNACVFLKDSCCTIQDAKPRRCRLYPFWVEAIESKFVYYFLTGRKHHPKGSLVQVKDWMKENFCEEDRVFLIEEQRLMEALDNLIHRPYFYFVDKERLLKTFLYFRYIAFDNKEPFFPQYRQNNSRLLFMLQRLIEDEMF